MLSQMTQQQQEDYLNDFIDALIVECKPVPPTSMDQDLAAMLETVRGVKRLRREKELLADLANRDVDNTAFRAGNERKNTPSWRKRWIIGAAAAATLFLVFGIFSQINRMSLDMESLEEGPAMFRSAEMAEDSESPAEAAPETAPEAAASEQSREIMATEALPDAGEGESPGVMRALESPVAGEDSVALFGIQEAMPNRGVAIAVKQIDTSYVELNLIDMPSHYQAFRLAEELKNTLNGGSVEQGSLYAVSFEVVESGVPVLTTLEPMEEAVLEARYLGRADSHFAEFLINGKVQVIALSEGVKAEAEALETELNASSEGVLTVITIKGSNVSTSGVVTFLDKISD